MGFNFIPSMSFAKNSRIFLHFKMLIDSLASRRTPSNIWQASQNHISRTSIKCSSNRSVLNHELFTSKKKIYTFLLFARERSFRREIQIETHRLWSKYSEQLIFETKSGKIRGAWCFTVHYWIKEEEVGKKKNFTLILAARRDLMRKQSSQAPRLLEY